jgi:ADP-ribose pyrophosphatase YjhB (NUDIX family)
MSRTYYCQKGCCTIKLKIYSPRSLHQPRRRNYKKAGAFIYDPNEDRVLLVQSRGQLWGPPKGSLEIDINETTADCAIREVKEETGLDINVTDFQQAITIKNRATYYYVEKTTCNIEVQDHENIENNDANGITWIKINCLEECIKSGIIVINQHCKLTFKRFMDRVFPKSDFVVVERRKRNNKL